MEIGNVIRKYRKEKNMTQEELADCLGITAPAVNKWENGNSLPDINLLAPIARILNVSLEELLSFRKDLSDSKIDRIIKDTSRRLKEESFEDVFLWCRSQIEEFPASYKLILNLAVILDASRLFSEISLPVGFDDYIESLYKRVLDSKDEDVKLKAADSLVSYYMRNNRYDEAESYLKYYSDQNPEKKRKQAELYYEKNQDGQAYKSYEEMLLSDYQSASHSLHGIYLLAMKNKDYKRAHLLADKQSELAKLFDMGRYYEVSPYLELAIIEQDKEKVNDIMQEMLDNVESIAGFKESFLYEHMDFKEVSSSYVEELKENLKKNFCDKEIYGFMDN